MHAYGRRKTWSERNLYVSAQFIVGIYHRNDDIRSYYRYESIEYIFLYTCIRIHNTYVPTYVRPTKDRQAQSYILNVESS